MIKIVKCQHTFCRLGGKVPKEEAIYLKRRYYHKECYREYQDILNIRDLCFQIDPTMVIKSLNIYLSKLIKEKQIETDYILFTLEFLIKNNIHVNMPFGLGYRLNDYRIQDMYESKLNKTSSVKIHSS